MADPADRLPENIAGRFFVDSTCIDCDLCRTIAPTTFRRNDEVGLSIVYHQPGSPEEIELAEEAIDSCPVNAIGNDGAGEEC